MVARDPQKARAEFEWSSKPKKETRIESQKNFGGNIISAFEIELAKLMLHAPFPLLVKFKFTPNAGSNALQHRCKRII